ncbi:MAG TPA: peptide-methionine (S)-S-oxide reductase MsrA [Chlamydiales bacterium]|nr:peptide-methionine (S)-S-oxide reductase MsrA [Chlamydiales bacterium]
MHEKATFAAGCFWGIETEFRKLPGVIDAQVGYTGGHTKNPTYNEVCGGQTGHAEAVEILFDPKIISYEKLLALFWRIHDPTSYNRQGPDIGSQYRSAIFTHNAHQLEAALKSKAALEKSGQHIVTEIAPAGPFYRAEEYHQRYHEKHGGSCGI